MTLPVSQFLLLGFAAACGAWLRYFTGLFMHVLFPALPMGTLVVNLVGGFLMGMSIAYFESISSASEDMRLIINVGLLGGLTTYSAYTAEIFNFIDKGAIMHALFFAAAHIIGALILCFIGFYLLNLFLQPS